MTLIVVHEPKMQHKRNPISDSERAIVLDALKDTPNGWQVYNRVGKKIGISYGSIRNIAKAKGIKLIAFNKKQAKSTPIAAEIRADVKPQLIKFNLFCRIG